MYLALYIFALFTIQSASSACYDRCYQTSVAIIPVEGSRYAYNGAISISSNVFIIEKSHQRLQSFHPMIFYVNHNGSANSIMDSITTPIKVFWSAADAGSMSAVSIDQLIVSEMEVYRYQIISTRNQFYRGDQTIITNHNSMEFYRGRYPDPIQTICTWNAIIRFSADKMVWIFYHEAATLQLEVKKDEISFEFVGVEMRNYEQLFLTLPGERFEPSDNISISYHDEKVEKFVAISVWQVALVNRCEGPEGVTERTITYETPNYGKSYEEDCLTCRHGLVDQRRHMVLVKISDNWTTQPVTTVAPPGENHDDQIDADHDNHFHIHSSASHLLAPKILALFLWSSHFLALIIFGV